jgi:uncharacterized protein (DUF4415 family)
MRAKSTGTDRRSASEPSLTGSDLAKVDAHVITSGEYEDIPELTQEWFQTTDMVRGGKLVRRGRPPKETPKVAVSIRLSADVVDAFKRNGAGWQTRIDEALADWLKTHPE